MLALLTAMFFSPLALAAATDYEMEVYEGDTEEYEVTKREDDLINDSLPEFPPQNGREYMDAEVGDRFELELEDITTHNASQDSEYVNITTSWTGGSVEYSMPLNDESIEGENVGFAIMQMPEWIPANVTEFLESGAETTDGIDDINATSEGRTIRFDVDADDPEIYAIFQYVYSEDGVLQECQMFTLEEELFYRFCALGFGEEGGSLWLLIPLFVIIGLFGYAMYRRYG